METGRAYSIQALCMTTLEKSSLCSWSQVMLQQFCSTAKWVEFLLFLSHIISLSLLLFNCSTIASAPSCCDQHICAGVHVCVQGHMAPSSEDWGSSGNILGDIFWVMYCCANNWLQVRCWWWLMEIHINSGHYEHCSKEMIWWWFICLCTVHLLHALDQQI